MKIAVGSDHFGYGLKETVRRHLEELGHEAVDVGCDGPEEPVDYPDVAETLARTVGRGEVERGILVCGTGIGMAISANKIPGVRAAVCHDPYSAERARKSNDAHVLCLGSQIVGPALALTLVDLWLEAEFAGGRSTPKVAKMKAIDERYRQVGEAL
jgi:ribose 5-phosphate isomerase B